MKNQQYLGSIRLPNMYITNATLQIINFEFIPRTSKGSLRCSRTCQLLRSTLGERNPNLKLDGHPVLYIPRYFEFFVRELPFGLPSWFLQGPASFSNLADFMVQFWSDSFSWLSVAVVLG